MTKIEIYAEEEFSTRCVHESGAEIDTTAPKDNNGRGDKFSPTDLLATALGSCILTVMEIWAEKLGVDLSGTRMKVEKEAGGKVRKVTKIKVDLYCPKKFSPEIQRKLEEVGLSCPVHHSLHPDMDKQVNFHWGEN